MKFNSLHAMEKSNVINQSMKVVTLTLYITSLIVNVYWINYNRRETI